MNKERLIKHLYGVLENYPKVSGASNTEQLIREKMYLGFKDAIKQVEEYEEELETGIFHWLKRGENKLDL